MLQSHKQVVICSECSDWIIFGLSIILFVTKGKDNSRLKSYFQERVPLFSINTADNTIPPFSLGHLQLIHAVSLPISLMIICWNIFIEGMQWKRLL